ncbi:unnamed protein product [Cyclocybe aegerita]|uniref:Protein kinase domain-containing protein n=1 Tax=Cyclocybe aegerita TaxID=1973307 RepID=A0A8S0W1R2_CYCAE|nr:unnamed protein product [Cyclocybe aegerita]
MESIPPRQAFPTGLSPALHRSSEHASSQTEDIVLEFPEEHLGLPSEQGLGYFQGGPGQRLGLEGRYEIVQKLGYGTTSSVWLAKDHMKDTFTALKILSGYCSQLNVEHNLQELDVYQRLGGASRKNQCSSLSDYFFEPGVKASDGNHLCLVLDLFRCSAADALQAMPAGSTFALPVVKRILRDVLTAMEFLHENGIVHTDIKPDNIMIPLDQSFNVDFWLQNEDGKSVDLTFSEEPLGMPAEYGFGYPIVNFGQRFGPEGRYEVIRKLGWGGYSSIWLARDHQTPNSFVALKMLTGNATDLIKNGQLQELAVMERLKPQVHDHCVLLLSHFEFPGTSETEGNHTCIVTEAFATDVERIWAAFPSRRMPISLAKKILRDVLVGLSGLHSVGCVHTDLKSANIMCRHPPSASYDAVSSLLRTDPSEMNPPDKSVVLGEVQSAKSQPLVVALSLEEALRSSYVLGDLGHAQILDNRTAAMISDELYRAPEVILGGFWDQSVDMWAFGCIVVEYVLGTALFTREHPRIPPDIYHIRQVFSVHLIKDYQHAPKCLDMTTGNFIRNPALEPGFLDRLFQEWGTHRRLEDHDIIGAADLASRCLRLNPEERPTAAELLDSCLWLQESQNVSVQ